MVAIGFEEGVLFGEVEVVGYHFGNHFIEGYFRDPAQVGFCFRGITKQGLYFCGTEVPRINPNNNLPCAQRWVRGGRVESGNNANFLKSSSFPAKGYTELLGCFFNELTHRVLDAGGDNFKLLARRFIPCTS